MTAILEIAGAVVLLLVSAWLIFDADDELVEEPIT